MRSADAAPALLTALHELLHEAFAGDLTPEDWAHALGGWHLVVPDDAGRPVAHAAVVERVLHAGGTSWRTGYVECVATRPDHQGRGLGSQIMAAAAEVVHAEFPLGALATGRVGFYVRLGWERWLGPSAVRTATGVVPTPEEDGGIMVLRTAASRALALDGPIVCQERPGDAW